MLQGVGVLLLLLDLLVIAGFARFGIETLLVWEILAVWVGLLLFAVAAVLLGRRMIRSRPLVLALDSAGITLGKRLIPWGDIDEVRLDYLGRNRCLFVHLRDPETGHTPALRRIAYRAAHTRHVLLSDIDVRQDALLELIRDTAIAGGCEFDQTPGKRYSLKARQDG